MILKTTLGYLLIAISFFGVLGIFVTIPKAFMDTAINFSVSVAYGWGYLFGTLLGYFIISILLFYIYSFGVKLKTKKNN